ncbi:VWA domain-containing protein [Marinobacter sp.]|uniref:VWA domain-containing protein n=1 Tax=Marinobacter sp. TaxID=50741 RepID=UPI00384BABA0
MSRIPEPFRMARLPGRLSLLLLALCLPALASAQGVPEAPALPEESDVRVLVDISGSMKKNDPSNLRQPAVRLLARMLPEGTEAGIWTFGQYVNMLVPHGQVDDTWRQKAIADSSRINSVAMRTNIGEALKIASDPYFSADMTGTHFIILTDGKVDIAAGDGAANERERQRILSDVLPSLQTRGATIHSVSLSEEADLDLMNRLATATGGSSSVAESADELNRVFLEALNTAVPQAQVPIENNTFRVDSGVEEFTALIFAGGDAADQAGSLVLRDPGGNDISSDNLPDNLRWASEPGYDLITVDRPAAGEWQLEGELGEGSRVTVVSDLRLVVGDLPARFYQGESVEVTAAFYEEQSLITDPDFLEVIEVSLTLTTADGRSGTRVLSGDQPPEDGVYRDTIQRLQEPGEYHLSLLADGQTFSRKFTRTITLRPPVNVVVSATGRGDDSRYLVTVKPEQPELDPDASQVMMQVARPGQITEPVALPFDPEQQAWQGVVTPEGGEGEYILRLQFQGQTVTGMPLSWAPESFTAVFPRPDGEQNARIPLGAEATPAPQPASEPPVTEAGLEDAVSPDSVDAAAGPVDLSQLEEAAVEPEPEPAPEPEAAAGIPAWVIAAGGTVFVALLGGAGFWFFRRRRKAAADAGDSLDENSPDPVTEMENAADEIPLAAAAEAGPADQPEEEAEPEPEMAADLDPEPEMAEDLDPEPEPELEPKLEPETQVEPEAEGEDAVIPEVNEEADDIDRLLQEATEDAGDGEPEPAEEKELEPEEEDDIFGMEEFDLSDIDELPDIEAPDDTGDQKKDTDKKG